MRSMESRTFGIAAVFAVFFAGGTAWSATELAKVNGVSITDADVKGALGSLTEGQRQSVLKDANTRRQILNSLIDQNVIVQEAEKEKLDQDNEYKEAAAAFRRQYLTSRILQKNLAAKLTEKEAK